MAKKKEKHMFVSASGCPATLNVQREEWVLMPSRDLQVAPKDRKKNCVREFK